MGMFQKMLTTAGELALAAGSPGRVFHYKTKDFLILQF